MDILLQLNQIATERDISVEELMGEIEEALAAAYKKFVGATGDVSVHIDPKKGWSAFLDKEVVGVVSEPSFQMDMTEARKRKPDAEVGDFIQTEVDPNRFGRIAAQTFKQVLSQKLREAETRQIHDVFNEKMGEVVPGVVSRREGQSVYIQVNRVETELPRREQVPTEPYRPNDRLRVYVLRVDDSMRRLRVIVSRTHPNLLRKLFELEIPEIAQGIVVINSVAREPGQRSKVAVTSTDERVDAVGACVGPRGSRVQAIVDELYDEKIDIVPYSDDSETYITNALSPAKVNSMRLNPDERSSYVVVPDNQLSLAIGKGGQNVRLAARLTDWKIDIRSETQAAAESKAAEEARVAEAAAARAPAPVVAEAVETPVAEESAPVPAAEPEQSVAEVVVPEAAVETPAAEEPAPAPAVDPEPSVAEVAVPEAAVETPVAEEPAPEAAPES